jgi:hypothetical protein
MHSQLPDDLPPLPVQLIDNFAGKTTEKQQQYSPAGRTGGFFTKQFREMRKLQKTLPSTGSES